MKDAIGCLRVSTSEVPQVVPLPFKYRIREMLRLSISARSPLPTYA
jgi:hypothetical protein